MTWAYDSQSRTNYDPATDEPICILSDLASVETMHARGRLIAVAPDMLEALQKSYEILCAGKPPHSPRESNARRIIRAILARTEPQP